MIIKKQRLKFFVSIVLILLSVIIMVFAVNESPINKSLKNQTGLPVGWIEYTTGNYTNEIPDLECPDYIFEEYNEDLGISKNEFLNLYEYCHQIRKRKENEQYTVEKKIQDFLNRCEAERSHDNSPAWDCIPENENEIIQQIREEFGKPRTIRIKHPPSLRKQTQEQYREEFKNYTEKNPRNDSWLARLANDTFYQDKEIPDSLLKTALIKLHVFFKNKLSWLFT